MPFHARSSSGFAGALVAAACAAWSAGARAADAPADPEPFAIEAAGPHALGSVLTAGPARTGPTLLASGGYGYTGSVLGVGDAHHRIAGALTLDERPLPWVDLALRLDGRYDAHVLPGHPTDTGLVGDPRLYVRVDQGWASGLRLGARAGLWLPGGDAPSLQASALSPELLGIASYAPPATSVALTANLGYRVDRSAHSAPDAAQLSPGDRVALEVSAFDEVLVGAAATLGRGPAQGFVEASADLLVGAGAPPIPSSPIFLGGGGRFALGRNLRFEAEVEVSPSSRPDTGATAPLAPIPPRFSAWLGLAVRFDRAAVPAPPPPVAVPTATPAPVAPVAPPPAPQTELAGRVIAAAGGKLDGLRLEVTAGGSPREVPVGDEGRFSVEGQPGDEVTVTAEATGCLPGRATVTLTAGPNRLDLTLQPRPPQGQIRGVVQSLRGAPVAADITIEPEAGDGSSGSGAAARASTRRRADSGRFEVDVPPGRYRLTISASGYQTQQRKVDVEENGVTVLNVDLRSER
jgi:hypothetical protein